MATLCAARAHGAAPEAPRPAGASSSSGPAAPATGTREQRPEATAAATSGGAGERAAVPSKPRSGARVDAKTNMSVKAKAKARTGSKTSASSGKKKKKPKGQPAGTDAWFARYSARGLRMDFPTLDDALLGVLAGTAPSRTPAPDAPGGSGAARIGAVIGGPAGAEGRAAGAVLGATIRRRDDEDVGKPGTPGPVPATPPPVPVPVPSAPPVVPAASAGAAGGAGGGAPGAVAPAGALAPHPLNPETAPPGTLCPVDGIPLNDPIPAPGGAAQTTPARAQAASPASAAPTAGVRPPPPPGPGSPDERRLSGLYRRSDPTRGWTGLRRRRSYKEVKSQSPNPDRWRTGLPDYGVHTRGAWWDPYNQHLLKGDYPIVGDRTFLVLTGISETLYEERHLPTPSNIPAARPGSFAVFGKPGQHAFRQAFTLSVNVFYGDTAFEPPRFNFRFTPVFNVDNTLRLKEVGVTLPDVRAGRERERDDVAFQELFLEVRPAITSPYFDFVSFRLGRQPFTSDFRGFVFSNNNRGLRIFGNGAANRNSFNLVAFEMLEHETNSELLREDSRSRGQRVTIANVFRQDLFNIPGYTGSLSFHRNVDDPSFFFDENGILVRPDPVGTLRRHRVEANYLGWTGDGHIGRLNVSHAAYHAYGRDFFNNLSQRKVTINAQMAALEASYDQDWLRYKASFFYASGDRSPLNDTARGFDSIIDDVNFAGGIFSFWVRQGIRLQGVNLKQRLSLVPDLRSSKLQGQSNFVNPGILLWNAGVDAEVTPKLKALLNFNVLRFHRTEPLELFAYQGQIPRGIGLDYSLGAQYRPDLNQNIVLSLGVAGFMPGDGFAAIYEGDRGLYQAFTQLNLTF
jgi:hypothetical protein